MKSQIQFWLGVWKASLAGIMRDDRWWEGNVTGRSLGKGGLAGLQGSGHYNMNDWMTESAEWLTDLALRHSYLETLHFVKFLPSLNNSILILEDSIEPIFLFFLYYHPVIISSAEPFISFWIYRLFFAPGCSAVYSLTDTQSRSLRKMHFESNSSCKFHIEGGKTKLQGTKLQGK